MRRNNRHYENYQHEIGRPLTSEEERLLDIAESYLTTDLQPADTATTQPTAPLAPETKDPAA